MAEAAGSKTAEDKAKVSRNACKGGTWRLMHELARVLREQRSLLER